MVFNTATVSSAIAPAVIQTFLSHYLNRKPLAQKPTEHISYDEGLNLIRKFLIYASHHTVEDLQRFTAQWVPCPTWVVVDQVRIPETHIAQGAQALTAQLGRRGVQRVGGEKWWQWRRPGSSLKAEWIEMRADASERRRTSDGGRRVMLYVHGGAYFFGSTDEHRYQMQRHARKLKARVFARYARYRLAPQFPFPCGLHDCLSAYLYLLSIQDPTTIILSGDSAGGGMVLSLLVTLRDQGIPLPAGAILISPWVDLTHSFPSVAQDCPLDYIPPHGFHQKPSPSWPPPNSEDMLAIEEGIVKKLAHQGQASHPQEVEQDAIQGFHVNTQPDKNTTSAGATTNGGVSGPTENTVPGTGDLSIMLDGNLVVIKDQIQMYATNQLVSHPLVSPILQPSLGGLPPLLILTGGGEMLRDEQIYLAHKAANPTKYPPGDVYLDEFPDDQLRSQVNKWKPTDVQLQVWEDLCHVAPTLSFTRPAKYMYRSIAQFGAWALARAQKTEIEILDDDAVSMISQSESGSDVDEAAPKKKKASVSEPAGKVGKAGDPLPPFKNHMIRQRVDRYGNIFNLEPASELPGCTIAPSEVGVIKEGPVRKWIAAKQEWDTKFASAKRKVQKQRAKEMAEGYQQFDGGEVPPPSALAGRRKAGIDLKEKKNKRSMGMSLWALWGNKHDEKAIEMEEKADREPETTIASAADGAGARALDDTRTTEGRGLEAKGGAAPRRRSRSRTVVDENQTGSLYFPPPNEDTPASELLARKRTAEGYPDAAHGPLDPSFLKDASSSGDGDDNIPEITIHTPTHEEFDLKRPKAGGIAFPFTIRGHATSASMTTLESVIGIAPLGAGASVDALDPADGRDSVDFAVSKDTGKDHLNTGGDEDNGRSVGENDRSLAAPPTGDVGGEVNGEVTSHARRLQLETSVTADNHLKAGSQK